MVNQAACESSLNFDRSQVWKNRAHSFFLLSPRVFFGLHSTLRLESLPAAIIQGCEIKAWAKWQARLRGTLKDLNGPFCLLGSVVSVCLSASEEKSHSLSSPSKALDLLPTVSEINARRPLFSFSLSASWGQMLSTLQDRGA